MNRKIELDVATATSWKEAMRAVGFCQADVDRLSGKEAEALWLQIRRLLTGEAKTERLLFDVSDNGDMSSVLSRIGDDLYIDGRQLRLVNCMSTGESWGKLAEWIENSRHPSRRVLQVLDENRHIIPGSWHLRPDDRGERWIAFLSTRESGEVAGLSAEGGMHFSRWDCGEHDKFDVRDYVVVIA